MRSDIEQFFSEYYEYCSIENFIESYGRYVAQVGAGPRENFLSGSELIREREVRWCQVLYWLLVDDSHSVLAPKLQREIMRRGSIKLGPQEQLKVLKEEISFDGEDRYDITLTSLKTGKKIVIEAKVNARYDQKQPRRYATKGHHAYLFLSLHPISARMCNGWINITWSELAHFVRQTLSDISYDALEVTSRATRRWVAIAEDFCDFVERNTR